MMDANRSAMGTAAASADETAANYARLLAALEARRMAADVVVLRRMAFVLKPHPAP
jgi:hypothetical protein